jgi:hypothetical protein
MASNSRTLEKKMWSRIFDDGLFDIYLGVVFINVVVWRAATELGRSYGVAIFVLVLLASHPAYVAAKRRITLPRVGYFKPSQQHQTRFGVVGAISVSVTILMVAATTLAVTGAFTSGIPFLLVLFGILAIKMVLIFSLAGHYLGVVRFYGYAMLGAAGMVGAEIAVATADIGRGWDLVAMFGLPAVVMVPTGIVMLSRFIRAYPMRETNHVV